MTYKIVDITNSPLKNKRYRVFLNDGTHYDFGLKGGSTFIDHKDKLLKENYYLRHLANPQELYLVNNLIPSPSLFSMYLLWGKYPNLFKNIEYLDELFAQHT